MKLATIEKIESAGKVENSDFLNKYKILGWQCISRGDYNVGDKVIYIRTDTIVQNKENPIFSFLEKQNWRIKTMKLRGEYSNGLILPWQEFFSECPEIGTEVSEQIGIAKYEKPVNYTSGDVLGQFPTQYVSKTDEENIQNIPKILNDIRGKEYYASVKMDGSSVTYINDENGNFRTCSRLSELKEASNSFYWIPVFKYDLKNKLPQGIAIQGELCGPKIQNNPIGLSEKDFYLFNAYDIKTRRLFDYQETLDLVNLLDIKMVPTYQSGIFNFESIDELIEIASKVKYGNGKNAEGLVFRLTKPEMNDKLGKYLSFKVINPKYKD